MYDVKWQNMKDTKVNGYRVPGLLGQKDVDLDLFQWDVLGGLHDQPKELSKLQRTRRIMLNLHLAKLNWPRFTIGAVRFLGKWQNCLSDIFENMFDLHQIIHVN